MASAKATKATKKSKAPLSDEPSESAQVTNKQHKVSKPSNDIKPDTKETTKATSKLAADRLERFKNLRTLKRDSVLANRSAVHTEYTQVHTDTSKAAKAAALRERAEQELAKIDSKERGEDFERKRAWDWTVAESEAWDKTLEAKKERENNEGFSDYQNMAHAAYEKEIRENLGDDKERLQKYQQQKMKQLKKHATLLEDEDGNLIAYDKDGELGLTGIGSGTGAALDQYESRPDKEDIDNLVNAVTKGDAQRMKRRKKNDGNGELVSYINEKNKQFNEKLSRHYDKVSFFHSCFYL